jgi:hypothetical protein
MTTPLSGYMALWERMSMVDLPEGEHIVSLVKGGAIVASEHGNYFLPDSKETVDHPPHYGGADNPYEAIKVIEAWNLGFNLGNTVKYISRADKKGSHLEDLKKARWYLDREIQNLEKS